MMFLMPLFISLKHLNSQEIALQAEKYMMLLGMVLLTDMMSSEKLSGTGDVIYQTKVKHSTAFIIRLSLAVFVLAIEISLLFIYAGLMHSAIAFTCYMAVLITSCFIGILGLFIATLTNIAVAYLIIFAYYMLDLMTHGQYFWRFTLFSYLEGGLSSKLSLLIGALCLSSFLFIYFRHRRSL